MTLVSPRVAFCKPCRVLTPLDESSDGDLREAQAIAEAMANPPTGEHKAMS